MAAGFQCPQLLNCTQGFSTNISHPPFAPCRESNNAHMDMCNILMIILILRKTSFFGHDNRPWQLARDARPTVIGPDKP